MSAPSLESCTEPMAWPFRPVSECIERVDIPRKIQAKNFLDHGGTPIISQEAGLINGYWNDERDAVRVDSPVVIFGDHTQVLKLVDFDFVVGADGVKVLKPKSFLNASFLKYFLEANPVPSLGYARHFRHVSGLSIPLPSLGEQKRIVAKLDQAFAALDRARTNAEANLADVDVLQSSVIEHQFNDRERWSKESLGARVRFIDYRGRTPEKTETGVPLLTAKNVRMGYLREDPREFIATESYASWMTRGIPKRGDVLFTTEAPLANVAQLETDEPVALAQRLITMQAPSGEIDPRFLKWSLMSPQMQADIKEKGTGATVTGIKAKLLKEIPLHVPGLDRQRQIAEICDIAFHACAKLRREIETKLADLAALRQSLLQAAFSGQLS